MATLAPSLSPSESPTPSPVETEEEKQIHDSDVQSLAFTVVVAALFLAYGYHAFPQMKRIEKFFPHASANMVFGMFLGLILSQALQDVEDVFTFNSEFFFVYLLPPIIFHAGYSLPKDFFFHNFGSIMLFAFVGTALSAFTIGPLIYAVYHSKMDFTHSMILGSLISAVDPVAVILVLKTLNVDEQLKVILFGESVLNDAAAVEEDISASSALGPAIPQMIGVTVSSMLIGTVASLTLAFLFKNTRIHKWPEIEFGVFTIAAFIPYALADALGLSGITAILFAGIMADYYTSEHLSRVGKGSVATTISSLSLMAESFVFVYLGMSFFLAPGAHEKDNDNNNDEKKNHGTGGFYEFNFGLSMYTLLLCFLGRAVSVFPLGYLLNLQRKHAIPLKHQIVLWYSGLRGPVAYALAVSTPNSKEKDLIISTTLFIVAFTNFIIGGMTYPFLLCLKPPMMTSTVETKTETYDISRHWFNQLDRRFLSPYFGPDIPRGHTLTLKNDGKSKKTGNQKLSIASDSDGDWAVISSEAGMRRKAGKASIGDSLRVHLTSAVPNDSPGIDLVSDDSDDDDDDEDEQRMTQDTDDVATDAAVHGGSSRYHSGNDSKSAAAMAADHRRMSSLTGGGNTSDGQSVLKSKALVFEEDDENKDDIVQPTDSVTDVTRDIEMISAAVAAAGGDDRRSEFDDSFLSPVRTPVQKLTSGGTGGMMMSGAQSSQASITAPPRDDSLVSATPRSIQMSGMANEMSITAQSRSGDHTGDLTPPPRAGSPDF